ncbi:MAG TPA: hypothetical protein VHV29_12875 [Terriglobales bacterium]|nr:hypothetical protein [Terriglobales bacterium]
MKRHLIIGSCWMLAALSVLTKPLSAQQSPQSHNDSVQPDAPVINPGRPTVSTPATLTPVGYFQFESGVLGAWTSPGLSSQTSVNEVVKFAVSRRIELLVASEPFAHNLIAGQSSNDAGSVSLGAQAVLYPGEGAKPTISASYFHSVYGGDAPDLDVGSPTNSTLLLASADVKKFHYDANLFLNEVVSDPVRRAQFGQSLSVSYPLTRKVGLSGEIWWFTQPFLHSNAVGNLWALNYNANRDLVFDGGFDRGLTTTSTRWEVFAGFTYLLPRRVFRH